MAEGQEKMRLIKVEYEVPMSESDQWSDEEIKGLIQNNTPTAFTVRNVSLSPSSSSH